MDLFKRTLSIFGIIGILWLFYLFGMLGEFFILLAVLFGMVIIGGAISGFIRGFRRGLSK